MSTLIRPDVPPETRDAPQSGRTPPAPPRPSQLRPAVLVVALVILLCGELAILLTLGAIQRHDVTSPSPAGVVRAYDERVSGMVQNAMKSVAAVDITTRGYERGSGTGVVVGREGLILTNYHVVRDAREITVTVPLWGRVPTGADVVARSPRPGGPAIVRLAGTVAAKAPARDLAIIRVPLATLRPIELGDSANLRLGQRVFAIGYALALTGGASVTSGIVSGLRDLQGGNGAVLRRLIQTDAPINRGNSGGPLIDASGRLVGITTLAADAGAAEDIGFAVGVDQARSLIRRALR